MTSYTVTHICGHTKEYFTGLFADNRDDAAKANAANTMCQDCIEYAAATAECDTLFRNDDFDADPGMPRRMAWKVEW